MKRLVLATLLLLVCSAGASAAAQTDSPNPQAKPLQVFVLVGQSNMQGHAHQRTLPHLATSEATSKILSEIQDAQGQPRAVDDVWISSLSSNGVKKGPLAIGFGADERKIGPELTFGLFMQQRVQAPIVIIKAAWGGKSLHTDFRPPSAAPFEFDDAVIERMRTQEKDIAAIKAQKLEASGLYYRKTLEHIQNTLANLQDVYPEYDPAQGYELAGLVWFQGWNDMVDQSVYPQRGQSGGYDSYSENLKCLIRDFRKDLSAPNLPIVIGVMGVGGPTDKYSASEKRYQTVHQNFRDAMTAPANDPEFKNNVVAVLTEESWDLELSALVERDNQLKNKLRQRWTADKTPPADRQSQLATARASAFTDSELEILETGVSNAAYHYLGSSKIMAAIGRDFALALPVESKGSESKGSGLF